MDTKPNAVNNVKARNSILIIDDEPDLCFMLSNCLNMKGFKVKEAYNGKEGLAAVRESRPDLIILDVKMPEMGGFEVLKHLKADEKHAKIPVIMLTAKKEPENFGKGTQLGADFYLPKPCNLSDLLDFIKIVLKDEE